MRIMGLAALIEKPPSFRIDKKAPSGQPFAHQRRGEIPTADDDGHELVAMPRSLLLWLDPSSPFRRAARFSGPDGRSVLSSLGDASALRPVGLPPGGLRERRPCRDRCDGGSTCYSRVG